MKLRSALLCWLSLTLSAWAEPAPPEPAPKPAAPQAVSRNYRPNLQLQGRLLVRYQQDGKEQNSNASFNWQQQGDTTRIQLFAPLGQTQAEIVVTPGQASLLQAGQAVRSAADVDQLTAQILGWPLPVAGLREWLQGFGHDENGARFIATDAEQQFKTSDGWRIRYASWHPGQGPKRIDLEHHINQQGADVYLRIVLDPEL